MCTVPATMGTAHCDPKRSTSASVRNAGQTSGGTSSAGPMGFLASRSRDGRSVPTWPRRRPCQARWGPAVVAPERPVGLRARCRPGGGRGAGRAFRQDGRGCGRVAMRRRRRHCPGWPSHDTRRASWSGGRVASAASWCSLPSPVCFPSCETGGIHAPGAGSLACGCPLSRACALAAWCGRPAWCMLAARTS